ncbi:MAG: type I methionyl aminopeptidase [Clostridia bacterium]|nr:type I methionyl aminopeptidase [Clostridia bacterium]MBQ2111097.1 type I methionyl aminopeptidase [Clostridia bacterium]MBQ2191932.1 type I methionyl aminopeptidase [Clostridia bacterium]MBQ5488971.1 type I methionyl aminopeptidase [Clostridia bacterium]MBR4635160.1 type I methionyl aminopeptidase [Clostridia bacterium]
MSERITIKSAHQHEAMKRAGELTGRTLNYIGTLVRAGVTTKELDEAAEEFIRSHGGVPSFLNYEGYPASICTSVNEQIVHGIPSKKVVLREGDIISVDCGAIIDGFHGDAARTFFVGEVSEEVRRLVRVTEECFFLGFEQAQPGNHIADISRVIQQHAEENGYGVVRELVGHGIGSNMHEAPEVPNYLNRRFGRGTKLVPGMAIAVEPMITLGERYISVWDDGWTCVTADGKPAAHYENTIFITENGPELLTLVKDEPADDEDRAYAEQHSGEE